MNNKRQDLKWKDIDWPEAEKQVSRLQQRIYKATIIGNKPHQLQRKLISSFYSRAIAVRRVTEKNRGRNTPGVDRMVVITSAEKLQMTRSLTLNNKASPIRRAMIPKPGKAEKRPLGIPTIKDRAKQMLVFLALEPQWEAKFEPNSYGFRPGRSCHDAVRAIFMPCRGSRKWVLDAHIQKCFDQIDHNKLMKKLETFSLIRNQVNAWLKAEILTGYADQNREIETSIMVGITPQGGILSPLLANIALHGMETAAKDFYVENLFKGTTTMAKRDRAKKLTVIRYADNFVVIADEKETVEQVKQFLKHWLFEQAGLRLSDEKTHVKNTAEGFDFLGFHLISVKTDRKWKFHTTISKKSKARHLLRLRQVIQKNKGVSAADLIVKLNPIIRGWCNYFRICECVKDFKQVEYRTFGQIRAWVFRRKSKGLRSRHEIKLKYFPENHTIKFDGAKHSGDWILCGTRTGRNNKQVQVFLIDHSWIRSMNYVKVKENASPYNGDHLYWALRSNKYGPFSVSERKLLNKQHNKCTLCKRTFQPGEILEKDHIVRLADGGKTNINNFQMVHRYCHQVKTRVHKNIRLETFGREPDEAKVSRPDLKPSG